MAEERQAEVKPDFGTCTISLEGKNCIILMECRPPYCDRGRYMVHLHVTTNDPRELNIDSADMFPRIYFDLQRAKDEMHDWLMIRKQYISDDWKVNMYSLKDQKRIRTFLEMTDPSTYPQ